MTEIARISQYFIGNLERPVNFRGFAVEFSGTDGERQWIHIPVRAGGCPRPVVYNAWCPQDESFRKRLSRAQGQHKHNGSGAER
jgi:hypothetical protein